MCRYGTIPRHADQPKPIGPGKLLDQSGAIVDTWTHVADEQTAPLSYRVIVATPNSRGR